MSGWDVPDPRAVLLKSLFDQPLSEDEIVRRVSNGFASDLSKILASDAPMTAAPGQPHRVRQRRG